MDASSEELKRVAAEIALAKALRDLARAISREARRMRELHDEDDDDA